MKKIIISLFALMTVVGMYADDTTYPKTEEINVIRIYSSERTGNAADYPVAEYQNIDGAKYSAQLLNGSIYIYRSGSYIVDTWTNSTEDDGVKYRVELQKIKVTVDGSDSNSRNYVNLGLTTGTLWAKTNVGGDIETDYGNYYAWGETFPYNTTPNAYPTEASLDWTTDKTNAGYLGLITEGGKKDQYSWGYYKWGTGSTLYSELYKYTSSDNAELESIDDAATVSMGSSWCMPSSAQMQELVSETSNYYITLNGVRGWRFVNKNDESKYIFLPSAGWVYWGSLQDMEDYGVYWSRDLLTDNSTYYVKAKYYLGAAYQLYFNTYPGSEYVDGASYEYRPLGVSVRAVRK